MNIPLEIQNLNLICLIMQKKVDLKWATDVDTSNLAAKLYLRRLKAKIVKVNIDKLKTVSADLSKLSNLVDNDVN